MTRPQPLTAARLGIFVVIVIVATSLRGVHLGRLSFWRDEIVAVRLAEVVRTSIYPVLLHGWIRVFGESEASARALSAGCGVLTVVFVFRVGRRLYADDFTALW